VCYKGEKQDRCGAPCHYQSSLRDKEVIEQLFTNPALVAFVAKYKPKASDLNLKIEFALLKANVVFYGLFWQKLGLYVKFTEFITKGMRKSDTDSVNLFLMAPTFELALAQCVKMATAAKTKDPGLYCTNFPVKVAAAFAKRKVDIATMLALAAAFVDPVSAFVVPPVDVPGGYMVLMEVMKKYYKDEENCAIGLNGVLMDFRAWYHRPYRPHPLPQNPSTIVAEAMAMVKTFRENTGPFFSDPAVKALAALPSPDEMWSAAVQALGSKGCEVYRFLVNGYAGQRASERINKKVKKTRNFDRNRQCHVVTEAMVKLHIGLHGRESSPPSKTYLQYRKEHIDELCALKAKAEAEAEAELLLEAAGAADNTEEPKEDDEDGDDNAIVLEIANEVVQEEEEEDEEEDEDEDKEDDEENEEDKE